MRIAIIGAGIAGNAAALGLSSRHDVTVYERESRSGGHSHTVTVDYDGTPIPVDITSIPSTQSWKATCMSIRLRGSCGDRVLGAPN